jgi:CheY-like chemotaxis protein
MTVPEDEPWRVLVVDDDPEYQDQVREMLGRMTFASGVAPEVIEVQDFELALGELASHRVDLVILDIRLDGANLPDANLDRASIDVDAGIRTMDAIRARRFVPIIFYTGLPEYARDLGAPPLIQIVEKSAGPKALEAAVATAFDSGLPLLNRSILRIVEEVQRAYMWDFVAKHAPDLGTTEDPASLGYLLARRLAYFIAKEGSGSLIEALGGVRAPAGIDPPIRMYLIPPVPEVLVGDLVKGEVDGRDGHWVVLSPSCDLMQDKAERVLLAAAEALERQPEAVAFRNATPPPSKPVRVAIEKVVGNKNGNAPRQDERHYALPGALGLPDLLVDFQQLTSVKRATFDGLERVASLDSPYGEALSARFLRYYSRLGTPDIDIAPVMARIAALGPVPDVTAVVAGTADESSAT